MPAFSNANDKTAITVISVKILFFLMKSIMNINNLFIKFLYRIINNLKSLYQLRWSQYIIGDLIPSIASSKKIIEKYDKGIKEGEFYEDPIGRDFNYPDW